MKSLFVLLSVALVSIHLNAKDELKGFLTTKWCLENGYLGDCRLESYACKSGDCFKEWTHDQEIQEELVLFLHTQSKYYHIKLKGVPRYKLDKAVNRNDITLIGEIDHKSNTITVTDLKSPPPPKKGFFKGCL
jgi:hypothetical protein